MNDFAGPEDVHPALKMDELKNAAPAVDPGRALDFLRDAGGGAGWEFRRILHVEPIRHRPRRRLTIRYTVEARRYDEPFRIRTVYGKLYQGRRGNRTHRILDALWTALPSSASTREAAVPPAGTRTPPRLPEPIGYSPRRRFLLLVGLDGRPLAELLHGPDARRCLGRFAIELAAFHDVPLDPTLNALVTDGSLPVHDAAEEAAVVQDAIDRVANGRIDAETKHEHERTARRVLACLAVKRHGALPNADRRPRLVHRDLYPDQVLVSDDRSALVDLDEVAVGEPELDLGNFTAHLTLGGLQRNGAIGASAAHSSAFLRAYHGAREIARHRLAVYEAGALVRLASLERLASQGGATLSWSTLVRELTARAERAMDSERRDPTL